MESTKIKYIADIDADITNGDIENEEERNITFEVYECLECHWRFVGETNRFGYGYDSETAQTPNFCPMCGKKIVDCIE